MNNIQADLRIVLYIILIVVVCMFWHSCHNQSAHSSGGDTLHTETKFKYDTTIYVHSSNENTIHKIDSIFVVALPKAIDTQAVLRSYYAKNIFQNVQQDSVLYATITDTVSENKIIGRKFAYRILRPAEIITTTIVQTNVRKVFIGAGLAEYNKTFFLSGDLMMIDLKERYYRIGYDPVNKMFMAGAGIKLHL